MKKFIFVIPLMAISLLACNNGGGDNPGPTPGTTYTLTFNCTNCRACDENDNEITSIDVPISDPTHTTYQKYFLKEKDLYKKPLASSIVVKKTGKEESVEFDYDHTTGEIEIPIVDNLTITASGINKTLEECTWAEINEISTSGRAKEFFGIYNPEKPELNCKRIQLKHQDTNKDGTDKITEGELYQTVRIIGFNEDYTELPEPGKDPDPNKSIGITFEFADLISDEKGLSLATYWNDTATIYGSNHNYKDSTIRKALNGNANDINWFKYYGKEEDTLGTGRNRHFASEDAYKKSVLDMLPDELAKEGILKTPAKYVNIWNKYKQSEAGWEEQVVSDKLFLLSPKETGCPVGAEEAHTNTYSYYKDADDSKRIKKQVKGADGARISCLDGLDLDGQYKSDTYIKFSYAGYDSPTAGVGGYSWLRSPTKSSSMTDAWIVLDDGRISTDYVYNYAIAVAPAFCI